MPTTRLSVKKEAQDASLQGEIVHRIKQEVKQEPLEDKKKIELRQIKQEVKQEPREHKQEAPDIKPARKMLDENGNSYWELGGNKRATLSKFKGTEYLNIRQYYHDADSGKF